MGKKISQVDGLLWEDVIAEDFTQLRKAGLDHPLMAEIEAAFKAPIATVPETTDASPAGAMTPP